MLKVLWFIFKYAQVICLQRQQQNKINKKIILKWRELIFFYKYSLFLVNCSKICLAYEAF